MHCLVRNVTPRQFKQVTLNQERGHDLFVFISFLLEPSRESAGPSDHFQVKWGQAWNFKSNEDIITKFK